jgi:hypothetical protein
MDNSFSSGSRKHVNINIIIHHSDKCSDFISVYISTPSVSNYYFSNRGKALPILLIKNSLNQN